METVISDPPSLPSLPPSARISVPRTSATPKDCLSHAGKNLLFTKLNELPDDQAIAERANKSNACSHFSCAQWRELIEHPDLHETKAAFDAWLSSLGVTYSDIAQHGFFIR